MKKAKLGKSDLQVFPIGLGTNAVGGHNLYPNLNEETGKELVREAIRNGVTMLDTAYIYGIGRSEELIGEVLREFNREDVVIATKAAHRKQGNDFVFDNSPDFLKKSVDESLKRLNTDYIDLFYIHFPDEHTPKDEAVNALNEMKKAGKIRSIGVSNFSLEQLKEANKDGLVDVLQGEYNLLNREAEKTFFPYTKEHNISFIPYFPLVSGLLAGKYTEDTTFPEGDLRNEQEHFKGERFKENIRKVNKLALNMMSVLNPNITHTMIDGAAYKAEVESKNIMAVPTVYLNGESFGSGRMTLEEILAKMGSGTDASEFADKEPFDVLVVGGGPAGASAAIYTARKGIRTGVVAERFGGQVLDTMSIENFISVKATEGPKLAASLEEHVKEYDIDVMNLQRAKRLEKKDLFELELENGAVLKSKTVILSTGARWRNVNVPGEQEFKNKGVAYCPHCDGPLFEGKDVAVIGGGNSGIEAAIDLAGIVNHVTVLEFAPELKADEVLQKRLYSLPNVTVVKNAQTKEITGDQSVNGITYVDRETGEEKHVELQGVFVQIGLVPNTEWLEGTVERNRMGEIIVDKHGATSVPGLFAAGDCTDSAYNQIIISMGSGATAALGAFDYLIRN